MPTDIDIARQIKLKPITEIATQLKVPVEQIEQYGQYKAKLPLSLIEEEKVKACNMILVTAISPTPAGEGKTTMSIGLTQGLNRICLLYTSPSPRDGLLSRMPSSA